MVYLLDSNQTSWNYMSTIGLQRTPNVNGASTEADNVTTNNSMPLTAYKNTSAVIWFSFPVKLIKWIFFFFVYLKGFIIENWARQIAGNWHWLGAERAWHGRCPPPGQPPHPWPILMPTVNTQKDFSKDAATLIALGSLPGRSHCSDTDSKVTVSGGSEDRLSCPRQSLLGCRIPEGLHCHQQSFSSVYP